MLSAAIFFVLTPLLVTSEIGSRADEPLSVRAMSFNIRYDTPSDAEHAWPHRVDFVASVIRFHRPDVVGLQEALHSQLQDLENRLVSYAWLGVGRDDGELGGEFSAILYNDERLEPLESGTFWLSETPDVPGSVGWDAAITRIVTWALFHDRESGARFYHFNTHFDHRGEQARLESARLLAARVAERAHQLPFVVTGDFNAVPTSEPYSVLSEHFVDAREATATEPHGPEGTFSGFTTHADPMRRIDYVFVNESSSVDRFATLAEHWEGRHASDHLPVLADVLLD